MSDIRGMIAGPATPPERPGTTRASLRRLSPLLLLAAALVALAVLLVHDSPPASADHADTATIWQATLTVRVESTGAIPFVGCGVVGTEAIKRCSDTRTLTDVDFSYGGNSFSFTTLALLSSGSILSIDLSRNIPAALRSSATLHVGAKEFALADGGSGASGAAWADHGLSWSEGDTVQLRLTVPGTTPPSGVTLGGDDLDTSGGEGHFDLAVTEGDYPGPTFTVALTDDPGGSVTVNLVKTQYNQPGLGADDHRWNANAGLLSPASLTFTSSNYGDAQTVQVDARDDDDSCNEQLIILLLKPATGQSDVAPVGGSSSSVTGVYVTIDDDEGGSCGGV